MSIGAPHAAAVDELSDLKADIKALGARLRTQQPVTLLPDDEPEPDGAIVVDDADHYRRSHPTAGQIHCVIEVADSSLEHDRTTKREIYGAAGIA